MIRVDSALKSYGSDISIGPIDLEIPRGGITALVGPNGAGKSTLLTMIGRLLGLDDGAIEVAGLDVATTKSADLAMILAILRQENHFVSRLTVRQLVGFGRFPHSRGRLGADDLEIVERALDFLDLAPIADRFLGGERQRAYVAMVLAQDTEYVLLDEPLNNLDIARAVRMMRTLRRAADELGRTVVIVLHDINVAAAYADAIIAMKDGRVAAQGTPGEILVSALLEEIFDTEIEILDGPRGPIAVCS